MKLQRLLLWIKWTGRLAALLGLLAVAVAVDGFMDGTDRTANIYSGYPGMSQPISGSSSKQIKSIQQLSYTCSSEEITLDFAKAESSVWHNAWGGTLKISPSVKPGNHTLSVRCEAEIPEKRITEYRIGVYKDISAYQTHLRSYIRRHWGIAPWWVFIGMLPVLVSLFVLVYYLSGRKASLMAPLGRTEIYRLKASGENLLIFFALGSKHGVKQDDIVSVYSPDGTKIGTVKVKEVFPDFSIATAPRWQKIKPDCEIRLGL